MADCTCLKCVHACVRMSGLLKPGDVAPIASYLGVGADELKRDYLESATDKSMRPRMTQDGCIFLKDQRCSIHAVKPFECREANHDLPAPRSLAIYNEAVDGWENS